MWSYDNSKWQNKNFASFSHVNFFLDENELDVNKDVLELMKEHISNLDEEIRLYLPDLEDFKSIVVL